MARIVKEYDERFNEFLNTAQSLFFSKGYEQTSVQDIINAIGVAKGTFYHYFASKVELLDALVERLTKLTITQLNAIVGDDTLNAHEKFQRLFTNLINWKAANKEFLLNTMRVLYRDENVLLLNKMQRESFSLIVPLLTAVIDRGVSEGRFNVTYPQETAEIIIIMSRPLTDALATLVLADKWDKDSQQVIERKVLAFNRNVERVLDLPEASLSLVDMQDLSVWFSEEEDHGRGTGHD